MVEQVVQPNAQPIEGKISFADFLHEYDSLHAEWLDGEVILISPVSEQHDELLFFVRVLLSVFLSARPLGTLRQAPFVMRILDQRHGREPDLMFISAEHAERLKRNYVDGPADMVLEIISPESVARDQGDKFAEYERAGVSEYWLLDPLNNQAAFYHLAAVTNAAGVDEFRYQRIEPDANGIFRSIAISGFRLHIETLWQVPLPTVEQALNLIRQMLAAEQSE